MDEPTKPVMMALAALALAIAMAPAAAADAPAEDEAAACQPVWIDSQGQPHVDPTCIGPVLDSRR